MEGLLFNTRSAIVVLALALAPLAGCSGAPADQAPRTPLYRNLGNHHHPITTSSPDAQKYFDQGLTLSYAFNHAEAIRAFRQAAELDPACAMCYWGVAFAFGPNINAPITEEAAKEAFAAIEKARELAGGASEAERAYIEALAKRYVADPKAERAPLDAAYAQAMRGVAAKYPDDLDAVTLFAQSLMDTSPWNYWEKDGSPRAFTKEVVGSLQSVMARNPKHAGALHLYIHAVEASNDPARGVTAADRLGELVPGAGHLVHMPAHIYLRVGRYRDATLVNEQAVRVDEAYFGDNPVAGNMMYQMGYYPHNIHFIVASASFEGRRAEAMKAAATMKEKLHAEMFADPAMGGMVQHFAVTPLFTMVRFGLWDQVLAEPEPGEAFPYMRAIWHASRGLAYVADGRLAEAAGERAAIAALKDDPALKTLYISSVNVASDIVGIADELLQGELAAKRRRTDEASRHFEQAVALEDDLTYMEPPDWPVPARQLEGAALFELGREKEAETAFRDDLKKFPDNGWSLSGLYASLERQGRAQEAAEVKARLDERWALADTPLAAGRPVAVAATR